MNKILTLLIFCSAAYAATEIDSRAELIAPYFDATYYNSHYADKLEGKEPLSHFLNVNFKGDFQTHTDPNSWFNTTLYLRCFSCTQNPFVDYLSQPILSVDASAEVMDVYAKPDQLTRAWLAVEALLRLGKFRITLHVTPETANLDMFKPQTMRGLELLQDNIEGVSFYKSRFLVKNVDGKEYPAYAYNQAVSKLNNQLFGLVHRAYHYNDWFRNSLVHPLEINIFHYVDEPLCTAPINDLISYVKRIYLGFDLVFFPLKAELNFKIIPGYMESWIDETALAQQKEFSISFLFSMAQGGLTLSIKGRNYHIRPFIWKQEKKLGHSTHFYVSRRDIAKYPPEYQERVLPTDSKKWIFDS